MRQIKSVLILFLSLSGFFSFNLKAQEEIWSLERCVQYALENNLTIKQFELNARMSENTFAQSKFDLAPNLNAGASHSYSFGRALDQTTYEFTDHETVQSNNFSLSSALSLFNGFQKINTIKQNRLNLMSSIKDVERIKNDISLNIASQYLQTLLNQELLQVAINQLDISVQQVERTEKLVNAGSLATGSLLEIQAQVAAEELQVINSQNMLDLSLLTLTQLLDLDSAEYFSIEIPELSVLDDEEILYSIDNVYSQAVNNLPEIKSAEFQLESSEKGLNIAQGYRSPRISLNGSYGSGYSDIRRKPITLEDYPFWDQVRDNASSAISLNLSIPIFNSWQVNTGISNAKISVLNSRLVLQNEKNQLYKTIQQAYADAVAALKRYKATGKAVSSMEESFRYTQQRFDVGLVNSVEYNTAKNQLARTQSDLLQAKYEYIFKINVLNFYMGQPIVL